MKTLIGVIIAVSIFVSIALAVDERYQTRFITSSTLTIHAKDGQFILISSFTQDKDAGQRGIIVAGVNPTPIPSPTPTPTATATPTPTLSTNAGAGVAISTNTKLNDSALLFGDNNPTGTITFTLFDPTNLPVYTDVVTVNGNGTYNTSSGNNPGGFQPVTAGTYKWTALYGGDVNNNAATDNGQNETVVVTATPTPAPTATPSPTPITAGVLTATVLNPVGVLPNFAVPSGESIKPLVIAGPATLTIDPVPGATLSVTYKKALQPIQSTSPTPTPTP